MDPIEIQETPDRDPIEIHIDVYKTVRVLCWDNSGHFAHGAFEIHLMACTISSKALFVKIV